MDGGSQLMHYTTSGLLSNGADVKVLAVNPTRNFINTETLPEEYRRSTRFESVTVDTKIRPVNFLLNLFREESYFIERFVSHDMVMKLQSVLETEAFDIIQLEHLYLCRYLPVIRAFSDAPVILRPQNVEYVIWERYIRGVKNPLNRFLLNIAIARLKKFEQNVNEHLDGIIALTREDADLFISFSDKAPVLIIPMGYDTDKLNGFDFEKQYAGLPVAYHLGSMDWLPNTEAIKWFLEEVFPILEKMKVPGKISIAGRNMPSWAYSYASEFMEISGEITAPLKYQEDKPVMIVPLLSGSGIRAKIIEGLALGKTIISTSVGAQGIDYENGKNILIADTPSEFAGLIGKCLSDRGLCRKIGRNARDLGVSRYQYKSTAAEMIDFYIKLTMDNG